MGILAHTLWAGAGLALARRRWPVKARTAALTMGLAALPDVFHLLPIVAWWLAGDGAYATVRAYAIAVPGSEPALPGIVNLLSHHLHCVAHSAIIAGAATLLVWAMLRSLWLPLLGWWSHVVIDVFTHSADFYPAPVLYPITQRGFDGLAWNTPWFMVANYAALGAVGLWTACPNWRKSPVVAAPTAPGVPPENPRRRCRHGEEHCENDPMSSLALDSELTCPHCGHVSCETMPTDACQFFYECAACKTLLRPKPGDCCVFCSFGSVKCPPIQAQKSCCG